jgi:hypothetical protein
MYLNPAAKCNLFGGNMITLFTENNQLNVVLKKILEENSYETQTLSLSENNLSDVVGSELIITATDFHDRCWVHQWVALAEKQAPAKEVNIRQCSLRADGTLPSFHDCPQVGLPVGNPYKWVGPTGGKQIVIQIYGPDWQNWGTITVLLDRDGIHVVASTGS